MDLPCLCAGTYRCNQCRARDWAKTCDCAFPFRCPQHRGACTCRANQPCDYHGELERERAAVANTMKTNAQKAATNDVIVNQLQTVFTIALNHWVVAMAARGVWLVAEITPQARVTHSHHRRRHQAEVVAAAVAAIRAHNNLTAEETR
jgi:hypothetical protein